ARDDLRVMTIADAGANWHRLEFLVRLKNVDGLRLRFARAPEHPGGARQAASLAECRVTGIATGVPPSASATAAIESAALATAATGRRGRAGCAAGAGR